MNNYQKFGHVAGQVFVGLGSALVGGIIGIIADYLRSLTSGMITGLFESILTAVIFSYLGLFAGISFYGYRFLKRIGLQNEFVKYFLQSFAGLISGLLIFNIMVPSFGAGMPHILANTLMIGIPLLGTILGFNFNLNKKAQRNCNV